MHTIEEVAIQTYEKNREYFSANHPNIIKLLNFLDRAFANAEMQARYDLEYIDGYFDAKELVSGNFLYATDSNKISDEFCGSVNFKKNAYTYEGVPVYHSKSITDLTTDKAKALEGVYPIMDYVLENTHEGERMQTIEKFIILGVALGIHISKIDALVQAKEYLIIEDDLELFRLSLFTTKYYELAQTSTLYFSVADDSALFSQTMATFLENSFFHNRYLKYAHFPTHSSEKLRDIQNTIMSQGFISFQYKALLSKNLRPLEYMDDGYKILNLSKAIKNRLFESNPVLLLTAGPSFHKNIEWLKENHERFIIVAVSATLKTLYKHNIQPTIITHIDGFATSLQHYEGFPVQEFLKNTLAILGPFSDGLVKKFLPKENVFYYEEDTEYIEDFKAPVMPCVGSFSLLMSLVLGAKELYLLGLDLALDQKSGSSHTRGHAFSERHDLSTKDELKESMSLRENLIKVRGNFQETVYTNGVFKFSIDALHNFLPQIKQKHQKIYNLNDGAYFENTVATNIDHVDVGAYEKLEKLSVVKELKELLTRDSVSKLNEKDRRYN